LLLPVLLENEKYPTTIGATTGGDCLPAIELQCNAPPDIPRQAKTMCYLAEI